MTPQTPILSKSSPKKCHLFTKLCICQKIIGRVSDSMYGANEKPIVGKAARPDLVFALALPGTQEKKHIVGKYTAESIK